MKIIRITKKIEYNEVRKSFGQRVVFGDKEKSREKSSRKKGF
jgi:hypothetical protein